MRPQAYSNPLAFSILIVLIFVLPSCDFRGIEDYSFQNALDEDVELYLYISHADYSQRVLPYHLIPQGEGVRLLTLESNDRGGFGHDYFHQFVDSVKVIIYEQEQYIAVWRQGGNHELAEGYETLKDFYNYWPKIHQHAGNHAEYAYTLEEEEE